MSQGKTKEEVRNLEMNLLVPEPIQEHIGESLRYVVNSEHTAKIVFKTQEDMDFWGKHIPITNYIERSITELDMIFALFRWIDSGKVVYNKKTKDFTITTEKEEKDEIQAVMQEPEQIAVQQPEQQSASRKFFLRRKQA